MGLAIDALTSAELDAVAALWRRQRREITTSFGGTSMLPAIAPGQQVVVKCGLEPAVGDVAVFCLDDRVGVHRVVARSKTWLLTWGDANILPDDPIEPERVVGTVHPRPAARWSLRRALLLAYLVSASHSSEVLTRRLRRLHLARAAWMQGAHVFAAKALRALVRRVVRS